MSSLGSYPSIFALGHKAIQNLLNTEVNVEEKVDGSQFSFGLVPASEVDIVHTNFKDGPFALKIRSRGAVMHIDAPEKMFTLAANTVRNIGEMLMPGWTYRGEYLAKPKHNSLCYERVPIQNIIIFDINTGDQEYLSYEDKRAECQRLGLECVPLLFHGRIETIDQFRQFLGTVSILGGQSIEGVVVKPSNYDLFGLDKKCLMGKFVSEAFKEVHRKTWGEENPSNKDIITKLTDEYTTPARWNKSIQHLRERGLIEDSPRDIGPLIHAIVADVLEECEDEMKERLFKYAWPHIRRGLTRGFPEWYKELLLKAAFEHEDTHDAAPTSGDAPLLAQESGLAISNEV